MNWKVVSLLALAVSPAAGFSSLKAADLAGPEAGKTCHVIMVSQTDSEEPEYEGKSVGKWIETLKDAESPLGGPATRALGKLGRKSDAVVKMLVELLDDKDRVVCMKAARALAEIGPKAKPAVPALLDAIHKHGNAFVAVTLTRIDPDPGAVVPSLTAMLNDENRQVRIAALAVLTEIGPAAKAAVPDIVSMLEGKDQHVPPRRHWRFGESIGGPSRQSPCSAN